MSNATQSTVEIGTGSTTAKPAGLFARMFAAIATAREIQAKREVARYLSLRSDRYLHDIGMDDAEIAELRRDQSL